MSKLAGIYNWMSNTFMGTVEIDDTELSNYFVIAIPEDDAFNSDMIFTIAFSNYVAYIEFKDMDADQIRNICLIKTNDINLLNKYRIYNGIKLIYNEKMDAFKKIINTQLYYHCPQFLKIINSDLLCNDRPGINSLPFAFIDNTTLPSKHKYYDEIFMHQFINALVIARNIIEYCFNNYKYAREAEGLDIDWMSIHDAARAIIEEAKDILK